jgi:lysophospholipase L1-like esterase
VRLLGRLGHALRALLIGGAVFLAAGEILARTFDVVDRLNGYSRKLYVASGDPALPYVLRPGFTGQVRGMPVRVNALGLRGPEANAVPAPGVRRVLVLGDSSTFGEGVRDDETFPARLAAELAARRPAAWEVLNAGVQGYNTATELAWLERRGFALRPALVIVAFNLNDYDDTPVIGPRGILTGAPAARDGGGRRVVDRLEFVLLLRSLIGDRGDPFAGMPRSAFVLRPGERFVQFDRFVSALRKRFWAAPEAARWEAVVTALGGLRDAARRHGVPLLVAIVPDGDQVGVENPDLAAQRRLGEACARLGLDCLDLQPALAAAAPRDGELYLDTMHPNAAGQRVIAATLAAHMAPHSTTTRGDAQPAMSSGWAGSRTAVMANARVTGRPAHGDRSRRAGIHPRSPRRW